VLDSLCGEELLALVGDGAAAQPPRATKLFFELGAV
jgi:hypothetical protein